jgi:transposase InsO family protein
VRTTIANPTDARPADLVDRAFTATRPNQLRVADFTYCPTWAGMVYLAFVFDVFSHRILGWRLATAMSTPLVLDCLEMAIWTRAKHGVTNLSGLIHHIDAGSTRRSRSPNGSLPPASTPPSAPSGTPTTRTRRVPDRPIQSRTVLAARTLARPRPPRGHGARLGALIQHRAHPRIDRRPHTSTGRRTPLPYRAGLTETG